MFAIYADDICIYNDAAPAEDRKVINPKLDLSDNASGSLTMTVPHNNVGYSAIKPLATEIRVTRNGTDYWFGRVIEEQKDWNNNRILTCEGALGYLNDTIQPRKIYGTKTLKDALTSLFTVHNQLSPHKFRIGTVSESLASKTVLFYTSYETTLSVLKTITAEKYGGCIAVGKAADGWYKLDWFSEYRRETGQEVRFQKNLLDISSKLEASKIVTAILPRGESSDIFDAEHVIKSVDARIGFTQIFGTPPETWYAGRIQIADAMDATPAPWEMWYKLTITFPDISGTFETAPVWVFRNDGDETWCRGKNGLIYGPLGAITCTISHDIRQANIFLEHDDDYNKAYGSQFWLNIKCEKSSGNCFPLYARVDGQNSAQWPKQYVTIEEINDGVPYIVNEALAAEYGFIEAVKDFPDLVRPESLLAAGTEYLNSTQFEAMTYEVSAFDLSYIDPTAAPLDLYDLVHCVSPPHGIDVWLPITKLTIPLDAPQNTTYTVGTNNNEAISSSVESTESKVHKLIY